MLKICLKLKLHYLCYFSADIDYITGKRGIRVKDFYRGKELALWLKLIPSISQPDPAGTESHELENADNISTFDDPTRLITKFRSIFPSPPPLPPYTPPIASQSDSHVTPNTDWEDTTGDNPHHVPGQVSTLSKESRSEKKINNTTSVPIPKENVGKHDDSSSVPLSAVVAVGGSLLFLNLLVFAGVYYQRKRILKLRECESAASERNNIVIGNNKDINIAHHSEGGPPNEPSPSSHITMNHKSQVETNPLYTAISKPLTPTPGGYSYSALSQKSSSPMHSLVSRPQETSEDERSARSSVGSCIRPPIAPDLSRSHEQDRSSPALDTRTKHEHRPNHHLTSNNAITIV